MKVDNDFIIHNFHAERYWNDIGILFSLHCNSYSITSIQDSQNFFIIPNFSIFSSHHGNLHNFLSIVPLLLSPLQDCIFQQFI